MRSGVFGLYAWNFGVTTGYGIGVLVTEAV